MAPNFFVNLPFLIYYHSGHAELHAHVEKVIGGMGLCRTGHFALSTNWHEPVCVFTVIQDGME